MSLPVVASARERIDFAPTEAFPRLSSRSASRAAVKAHLDGGAHGLPVGPSPESTARAKRWWTLDCEMCHGKNGDGTGDTAREMKLAMMDFTNPDTLKDRTDGELFYIIKNGHNDMPAEGPRVKTEEAWDLVNYVRTFAKKKDADAKAQ